MLTFLFLLTVIMGSALVFCAILIRALYRTQREILTRRQTLFASIKMPDVGVSPDDEQLSKYAIKHRKSIAEQINAAYALGFEDAKNDILNRLND